MESDMTCEEALRAEMDSYLSKNIFAGQQRERHFENSLLFWPEHSQTYPILSKLPAYFWECQLDLPLLKVYFQYRFDVKQ